MVCPVYCAIRREFYGIHIALTDKRPSEDITSSVRSMSPKLTLRWKWPTDSDSRKVSFAVWCMWFLPHPEVTRAAFPPPLAASILLLLLLRAQNCLSKAAAASFSYLHGGDNFFLFIIGLIGRGLHVKPPPKVLFYDTSDHKVPPFFH